MKKKLHGIIICMLLLAAAVPVVESLKNTGNTPTILNHKVTMMRYIKENVPPVFGTPSPMNNSLKTSLNFTWSISINDPDGDGFNWSIQCNNGQENNESGASNGTKSLQVSGLLEGIVYTVWVNATDPTGSAQYTRAWYRFTTKINEPPVFGIPEPANGSTKIPLNVTWSIPIIDPDGDNFNWAIHASNGQSTTALNASNGTKSLILSNLSYATMYTIWVNATDGNGSGLYTRAWYTIITRAVNEPPVFGIPQPANQSMDVAVNFTWGIPINDLDGDVFNWSIQCSNGQGNNGTDASNGTKSLLITGLASSTPYKVWVNATDPAGSNQTTTAWYIFTTQAINQTVITITATPTILWPPNHKMRNVLINGSIIGAPENASVIFTVEDEYHFVEPTISSFGQIIQLHAWRFGNDLDGRTYTITVTVTDGLGHTATASTIVLVPHDQGN